MVRFLVLLLLVGALAAWWLGYIPGHAPAGARGPVDPQTARERGAQAGEQVAAGINRVTQTVDDAALTAKIKSKMALDDVVQARTIDVTTNNRVVTLSGTVRSAAEHDRAVQLAKETDGVTRVVDRLAGGR